MTGGKNNGSRFSPVKFLDNVLGSILVMDGKRSRGFFHYATSHAIDFASLVRRRTFDNTCCGIEISCVGDVADSISKTNKQKDGR